MKKKTLITLLVVLLSLVIALTAFACGGPKPPPKKPTEQEKPTKPAEIKGNEILTMLLDGVDKTYNAMATLDDAAYLAFTIYVEVASGNNDPTKLEVTLKGNFDAKELSKNNGFVEVKDTLKNKVILSAYVANNIVYIGETITKPTLNWFKLSQAEGTNFIKFFGQLPGLLKDNLSDVKMLKDKEGNTSIHNLKIKLKKDDPATPNVDETNEMEIFPLITGSLGGTLLEASTPLGFEKGKPETFNGDYGLRLQLEVIGELLPFIKDMLLGAKDYLPLINMLLPTLLGLELKIEGDQVDIVNAGVAPSLGIDFALADGAVTKLGLYYIKEAVADDPKTADIDESSDAISVKFGIKNLVVGNASGTSITPSDMPKLTDIGDGAIKLTAKVELGAKGLGPVDITAFVKPDFSVDYAYSEVEGEDDGGFSFNFNGIKGFAYATVEGQPIPLAIEYDAASSTLAFELAGVYQLLGIEPPEGGTKYFNNTLSLYDLFGVDAPVVANAESDNPIDKIAAGIKGGDIMGIIMGSAGDAFAILKSVFGIIGDVTTVNKDDASVSLNLMELMAALATLKLDGSDDLLLDSTFLEELFGNPATHYLVVDNIIAEIAAATGKTEGEINEIIKDYSGVDFGANLAAYLAENNLTIFAQGFAGETATNGLGFALEVKAGSTSIAKLSLNLQFVTFGNFDTAFATYNNIIGDADLSDPDVWAAFVDAMKDLLDDFASYSAAA